MILEMSSNQAVHRASMARSDIVKWSRSLRVAVALASATASWVVLIGAGYLVVQLF